MRLLALGLTLLTSGQTMAQAMPTSTQIVGRTSLVRAGRRYTANPGTKLIEGDAVSTSSFAQFNGDFNFWFGHLRNGTLVLSQQRRSGCGTNAILTYWGGLSLRRKPKLCPQSSVTAISGKTGSVFEVNSSIELLDRPNETVLAVYEGTAKVLSAGQVESINTGFGNLNKAGCPPGPPIKLDLELMLSRRIIHKNSQGATIELALNPLNSVFYRGKQLEKNKEGKIRLHLPYQNIDNKFQLVVQGPNYATRTHTWPAITRK